MSAEDNQPRSSRAVSPADTMAGAVTQAMVLIMQFRPVHPGRLATLSATAV